MNNRIKNSLHPVAFTVAFFASTSGGGINVDKWISSFWIMIIVWWFYSAFVKGMREG